MGSAALSVATEKLSNVAAPFKAVFGKGVLDGVLGCVTGQLGQSAAGRIALSAISEGGEELIEDIFQPILQRATYDKDARFDLESALYDAAVSATLGGVVASSDAALSGGVETARERSLRTDPATQVLTDAAAGNGLDVNAREAGAVPAARSGAADSMAGREKAAPREGADAQPDTPLHVGRVTTIQKPYQGVTPVQTQKPAAAVTVNESSVRTAENRIAGARELENSVLRTSFKATLKNAYKAVFKAAKDVPVEGVTCEGKPYTVDINNTVPGKVINDPNLTAEKLALLDILPDVVRSGEYVGSGAYVQHGEKQKLTVRFDYFETPAEINGKPYIVAFDVEVFPNTNNYRTHKLHEIELSPVTNADVGPAPTASVTETVPVEGTRPLDLNSTIQPGAKNVNPRGDGLGAANAGFTTRGMEGAEQTGQNIHDGYGADVAWYMRALDAANAAAQLAALEEAYQQNTVELAANVKQPPQSDSAARNAAAENAPLQREVNSGDMLIRQYAYDLAAAMLTKGEMPDAATLSAAGISAADAMGMMMAAIQKMNEAQETNRAYFQENVDRFGKIGQAVDKYGTMAAAAVPQALMAMATAGGSGAAEGLKTAANAVPGVLASIKTGTQAMLRDPQYWLSFFSTVNDSAEQARADGVDDVHAALYAMTNSLFNAGVEVGGGIQTLPKELRAGKTAALEWVRSMVDEGKEEAVQGVLERGLQNLIYQKENPVFSATDPDAVFNPRTAAEEFTGGAVVGGLLGGGQVLAGRAIDAARGRGAQREAAVPLSDAAVNQNGLLAFSTQERINLSSGAKNKVITTFNDAVAFIKTALANKQSVDRAFLGKIPESVAEKVLNDTGVDIYAYNAVLPSDAVRHIFKNHGNPKAEALRGQIAVTPEMAAAIPGILAAPDRVYLSDETNARRLPVLMFEKQIDNYYITAQAVADGSHSIQTDTLYIRKKNSQDTVSNADRSASPEHNARSAPPQSSSLDSLSQSRENSNDKKGTSTSMVNAAENAASTYTPEAVEPEVPVDNMTQGMKFVNPQGDGLGAADAGFTTRGMEGAERRGKNNNDGYDVDVAQYIRDLYAANSAAQLAALEEAYQQNTAGLAKNARQPLQSDSAAWSAGAENAPLQREAAYEAGRYDAENQLNQKGEQNHGEPEGVHLRDGGQRPGGADSRGELSGVAGGAGQDSEWAVAGGPADREAAALTYGKEVSTGSLGNARGANRDRIREVARGETAATREAKRLAKERGLRVILFGGNNLTFYMDDGTRASVRGFVSGDRVFIRADHPYYTSEQIMRHEIGHDRIIRGEIAPDTVRERIAKEIGAQSLDELAGMYEAAYRGSGLTADEVWEEVICDSLEDMNIFSGTILEEPAGNLLAEVKKEVSAERETNQTRGPPMYADKKEGSLSTPPNEVSPVPQTSETTSGTASNHSISQITEKGKDQSSQTGRRATETEGRFSLNLNFPRQFDEWMKQTDAHQRMIAPGYFRLGTTSGALKSIGVRDGNIYWRKQKMGYILADHPEITADTIKAIPDIIEAPVIVMKSRTREDSIVLFGDVTAANGDKVMAALELTPKATGSMEAEFSLLTSAYGRSEGSVRNLVEHSEILYLDPDKKRTDTWLMSLRVQFPSNQPVYGSETDTRLMQLGVQFPSRQPVYGSIGSIRYEGGKVKIAGKTLAELGGEVRRGGRDQFSQELQSVEELRRENEQLRKSDGSVIKIDNGESANPTSLAANGGAGTQSPLSVKGTRPFNSDSTIQPGAKYVNPQGGGLGAADAGFTTRSMEGAARSGRNSNGGHDVDAAQYMRDLYAANSAVQLVALEEVYQQNTAGLTANAGQTPRSDPAARNAGAEKLPLQRRVDSGDMLIRQYAYDLAAAILAKGEMPSRATLEAAGIPSADAINMMMKVLQGDLGAAAEHRLRAWNLPGDENPLPNIRAEGQDKALQAAETGATMEPETDRERADGGIGQPDRRERGEGQRGDGLHAGGESTPSGELPRIVGKLERVDREEIVRRFSHAARKMETLPYEVNCTVTKDGRVWFTKGAESTVHPELIAEEYGQTLEGSYSYHNHPIDKTYFSMSAEDVGFFFENKQQFSMASDLKYRYFMERTAETTEISGEKAKQMFREAYRKEILQLAHERKIDIDNMGNHEIMRRLSERLHFYYERTDQHD